MTFLIDDHSQEFELMHQCQINSFSGVLLTALSPQPNHFEANALDERAVEIFLAESSALAILQLGYVHHFY